MPGEREPERSFRRELLFSLPSSNLERDGDALTITGVKLLAAGTWTDSAQKTPCEYSPDVLSRYASNWVDSSLWSRHNGGVPRNITEKVGTIRNQHFEDDAITGDLRLHGLTSESRDTIAMIEGGEADYFSAELTGKERWNPGRKLYELQEFTGLGGAVVNRGACATCTLRHNEEEPGESPAACTTDDPTAEPPTGAPADSDMELEELSTKIAELEQANVDLTRQLGEAQETIRSLGELDARLKKLESAPAPKTAAPAEPARELTEPPRYVTRNGETYLE